MQSTWENSQCPIFAISIPTMLMYPQILIFAISPLGKQKYSHSVKVDMFRPNVRQQQRLRIYLSIR